MEGAHFGAGGQDVAKYGIHVVEDVASRDAHDAETLSPKHRIARRIALWLIAEAVRLAIDLNCETMFEAREIDGDPTGGKLSTKF